MSEKDFDKGYKSGFQFGKEVANQEWMNKVKQAKEEIAKSKIGLDDWNENDSAMLYAYDDCLYILDKLITDSEGANEK